MIKILIIEDEPAMLAGLCDNLEFEGYTVHTADRGDNGLKLWEANEFDLILLDVMLPGLSGFEVLKQGRKMKLETPVILLTARGEEMDKVRGLELGADDYITKPFSLMELMARIKAILRRSQNGTSTNSNEFIEIGHLKVSFKTLEASDESGAVKMSHKEFEILQYLYKHTGMIVSRENLLDSVWGNEYQPIARTVDNFILRLRQKVDRDDQNHIITVHGVGYKLVL